MPAVTRRFAAFAGLMIALAKLAQPVAADDPARAEATALRRFDAPEATQAVAADATHFYAIGNRVVAKYDKQSGERVAAWQADDQHPLLHLNSGIVHDGRLYCAHSNFPHYPETSSVEVWDVATLEHVDSHSLGMMEGSLTVVEQRGGGWSTVFAHDTEKVNDDPHARDAWWTSFVQFDRHWQRQAGWVFPAAAIERFQPHSCSGAAWRGEWLYCTGHDRGELYELAQPQAGSTQRLVQTIDAEITGQGIAWDPAEPTRLWGIDRPRRQAVLLDLSTVLAEGELPNVPSGHQTDATAALER